MVCILLLNYFILNFNYLFYYIFNLKKCYILNAAKYDMKCNFYGYISLKNSNIKLHKHKIYYNQDMCDCCHIELYKNHPRKLAH